MSFEKIPKHHEDIGKAIVNAAFRVHKELGPGLLERIYEVCLAHELRKSGYNVARQVDIPIQFDVLRLRKVFDWILVENLIIVEIKAVDTVNPSGKLKSLAI